MINALGSAVAEGRQKKNLGVQNWGEVLNLRESNNIDYFEFYLSTINNYDKNQMFIF